MIPALVFVLILAAVGTGVWLSYRAKQRRREALFGFATERGLEYSRVDPFALPSSYAFHLFGMGDGRGCENVLSGTWDGLPVREADYWYYTESSDSKGGRSKSYSYFSVVVADLDCSVPRVSISKETLLTRAAEHLGASDLDFESEEFNRMFKVTAQDPQVAYQLIDPRMMNWLLSTGGAFGFEVVGPNLLVYSHRRRPTELIPLFGSAQLFRDHIPRLVRTEYGIRQGEGTDPTERSSS